MTDGELSIPGIRERQDLIAELVLMWGSHDAAEAASQIRLLVRQTAQHDVEVLRRAVRHLLDTWEGRYLPGPAHIHAAVRAVRSRDRMANVPRGTETPVMNGVEAQRLLAELESNPPAEDDPVAIKVAWSLTRWGCRSVLRRANRTAQDGPGLTIYPRR